MGLKTAIAAGAVILLIAAAMPALSIFGCEEGSGNIIEKDFEVNNFDAVVIEGNGLLYISQDDKHSVRVETDDNIMPLISVKKRDGILFLSTKENVCTKHLKFFVSSKNIAKLGIGGSGDIIGVSPIKGKSLKMRIEGSGDIKLKDIEVDFLSAAISGSGDIRLDGKTDQYKIKIEGAGDIYSYDLKSKSCEVSVSGSGDVQINVSDNLTVSIAGSGDVLYKGSPKNVIESIAGSGDVRALK